MTTTDALVLIVSVIFLAIFFELFVLMPLVNNPDSELRQVKKEYKFISYNHRTKTMVVGNVVTHASERYFGDGSVWRDSRGYIALDMESTLSRFFTVWESDRRREREHLQRRLSISKSESTAHTYWVDTRTGDAASIKLDVTVAGGDYDINKLTFPPLFEKYR